MISLLQAIAEPTKHQILVELSRGPKRVSDLVSMTGHKQPNLSNHLAKLRGAGLVHAIKRGREVFYSLSSKQIESAVFALNTEPAVADRTLSLEEYSAEFARLAVLGEEAACLNVIDAMVAAGVPSIDLYQKIIAGAMNRVGDWYESGSIEIIHEHLASAIADRALIRVHQLRTPIVKRNALALVGCAAGNYHTIGARIVGDVLQSMGWETKFLGANTPAASFVAGVRLHQPKLVLVSLCLMSPSASELGVFNELRALKPEFPELTVGAGGQAVAHYREQIIEACADFACADLDEFLTQPLLQLFDHEN